MKMKRYNCRLSNIIEPIVTIQPKDSMKRSSQFKPTSHTYHPLKPIKIPPYILKMSKIVHTRSSWHAITFALFTRRQYPFRQRAPSAPRHVLVQRKQRVRHPSASFRSAISLFPDRVSRGGGTGLPKVHCAPSLCVCLHPVRMYGMEI